jgi:hypothetical protein
VPAQDDAATREFRLTAAERQTAIRAAEQAITERQFRAEGPLYLVDAELVRGKAEGEQERASRLALITHYRYSGDVAIRTLVDAGSGRVLETEAIPHLPVPLAKEEFDRARELALADPRVRETLGAEASRLRAEALVVRTADERDSIFGHRVVRLLFRRGQDYLTRPIVLVDLTAGRVLLEEPPAPPDHHSAPPGERRER